LFSEILKQGELKMTDKLIERDELALQAWKNSCGDALTAVKVLRDSTGLSLREAFELIQKTAARVGGRCNLRLFTEDEARRIGSLGKNTGREP
jgi:hypothetical protein